MQSINTKRIRLSEVQENRFYQLPKFLVHDEQFKKLSGDAKILYSIMRDRHELSIKNNWVDDDGYVYIIYSRDSMMEDLGISDKTATKYMKELKKYGLIDEVRQGLNKPNIIYVLTLDLETQWNRKKYGSGTVKSTVQEPKILRPNDTNTNDTEFNKTTTHSEKDSNESVVVDSPNKDIIESQTILKLTNYQSKTVTSWDTEKLNRAVEIFNIQDGQTFSFLLKIYRAGAINNLTNTTITTQKVNKFNEMDSRDLDFEDIDRLEREYIDRKLQGKV